MVGLSYKIVRTLRCKNLNVPGTLGKLATTIGRVGVEIGNISTVSLGHHYTIRDIDVLVESDAHLDRLIDEISRLPEVSLLQVRDEVLELHENGKIKTVSTVPINSLDVLRKVYTPGVAEVCKLIVDRPGWKDTYTSIPYSVAVVTDGTAILGLGNIGPVAGMPVMEGKAALLEQLVGISGIPILINTEEPAEIIETVKRIAPTFGGIHLEDIASPRCFVIEETLANELSIPVMHDDQKGTSVVALAALINACKLGNMDLKRAQVGLIGLGAAGLSIGKFILQYTGNPTMGTAKTEASKKRHAAHGGIPSTLEEIMREADIVIATSGVAGLIDPKLVRKGQIIFALSNPYPEITPEAAIAVGAAIAADGRMINNLLGYPGLWRGTLDAKASKFNFQMFQAAALAIVDSTSKGELIPSPLDPKVHLAVTHAVARAAMESGAAQRQLDADYFENTDVKTLPPI
ncbi:MAG: NAD-dependent malic enzyme [Chloroflexi bacterium]|nr:NAD-dependent malic enzyme [Chloroflexota bacterium]